MTTVVKFVHLVTFATVTCVVAECQSSVLPVALRYWGVVGLEMYRAFEYFTPHRS